MKKYIIAATVIVLSIVTSVWLMFAQRKRESIYVGEKVCRQCHHLAGNRDQFNPWRLSQHADAYAALFKSEAKPIADLSGIDIKPHQSPICLGCHTTACYVEDWERGDDFRFEDGVQCELCHGPGSEYSDIDIMRDADRAVEAGLRMPVERECNVCHKEKNSHTAVLGPANFVYEDALRKIAHPGAGGPLQYDNNNNSDSKPRAVNPTTADYLGAYTCAECHGSASMNNIYGKWHYSPHARAYAALGTEKSCEIARQRGLPETPQKSSECLRCHAPGAGDEVVSRGTYDVTQGVQCESCHGPGAAHVAAGKQGKSSANAIHREVKREVCAGCHTGENSDAFDYDAKLGAVNHSKWRETYKEPEYKTPFNLAVTADGERLFVACEASNSLIVIHAKSGELLAEIAIGAQPHFVCFSPDQRRAYVSNRASDSVSIIDTQTYEVLSTLKVGDEPHEMAVTSDGATLYVANAGTYDVSVVDLERGGEVKRLAASRGPWGAALSGDGRYLYITNNLPRYGPFRETSKSELTVIDTKNATVRSRVTFTHANLMQGVAVAPDEEFILTTLIRTKNLVPMTRNIQGWIITNGIGILWKDGSVDQLLLDEINDFFADPTDVVFSGDGKYAFVSGGGVQEVAVLDIAALKALLAAATEHERREVLPDHLGTSFEYVLKRIPVGRSPRGMAVSADNRYLYVADGLDDAISVIDIGSLRRIKTFDLGGPTEISEARYGERIFHSAEVTYGRQFSCHSCHPDGGIDGLTYDIEPDGLGINPVDNRTLRGINDTAPFKWTGKNPSLKRQCGARLAAFFTRIDPFSAEQSAALDRYIVTIPRPPNRFRDSEQLSAAQRRGKRIFERTHDNSGNEIPPINRCNFCHTPPYFTNREIFDVGSASWIDTHSRFDVPHLNNIYATPPYLHDGRASSLEEIWTVFNPDDTHGVTNDLTKDELNDLIEYLKTL